MSPARRNDSIMIAVGLFWIVLDQLVKHWITSYFTTNGRLYSSIPLVGNILEIIYEQNNGVAFSLLEGQAGLYILIVVAIGVIGWLYWRTRDTGSLWLKVTFGLIIGGAIGNLIDRLRLGYVVDFIHFQLPAIHFSFAVFNVADAGISVGVVLLIFQLLFSNRSGGVLSAIPATEQATSSSSTPNTPKAPTAAEIAVPTEPKVRRRVASGRQ